MHINIVGASDVNAAREMLDDDGVYEGVKLAEQLVERPDHAKRCEEKRRLYAKPAPYKSVEGRDAAEPKERQDVLDYLRMALVRRRCVAGPT